MNLRDKGKSQDIISKPISFTPFYQNVVYREGLECSPEPLFNFKPYDLFCLETKLVNFLMNMFDENVFITFDTERRDSKIYQVIHYHKTVNPKGLTLTYLNSSQDITRYLPLSMTVKQFEDINEYIDYVTSENPNYCLVFSTNQKVITDDGLTLPKDWISSVLPYIDLGYISQSYYYGKDN